MTPLILLVEDYADAREMYRAFLVYAGFRVETAANGFEAIDTARELLPDLILMDLSLPALDGWQATERLTQDERTSHIPVVALSAHTLAADTDRARMAGCRAFIQKPCLPEQILLEVCRHVTAPDGPAVVATEPSGPERV